MDTFYSPIGVQIRGVPLVLVFLFGKKTFQKSRLFHEGDNYFGQKSCAQRYSKTTHCIHNGINNKGLTFAVDLSFLVADSSGVQLLVANGAVEAADVPALERERGMKQTHLDQK